MDKNHEKLFIKVHSKKDTESLTRQNAALEAFLQTKNLTATIEGKNVKHGYFIFALQNPDRSAGSGFIAYTSSPSSLTEETLSCVILLIFKDDHTMSLIMHVFQRTFLCLSCTPFQNRNYLRFKYINRFVT